MNIKKIIKFLQEISKLNNIERTGWKIDGVRNPESISEHIFMVSLMTLFIGKNRKDIDLNKAVRMALIHDIEECKSGDLVLDYDNVEESNKLMVSPEEKKSIEKESMKKLVSILGEESKEYNDLWNELANKKSKEANFVEQTDKLQMALQAFIYEKNKNHKKELKNLDHYFKVAKKSINDPELTKILERIIALRRE